MDMFIDSNSSIPSTLSVAALLTSYEESESVFKDYVDVGLDFSPFNPKPDKYSFELIRMKKSTAWMKMNELFRSKKYNVFLNLCDGTIDDDCAGFEVTKFLEEANIPSISPSCDFYSISKRQMKYIAKLCHIPIPEYFFVFPGNNGEISTEWIKIQSEQFTWPLLVKHYNGSGSEGLSEESKVQNAVDLLRQTEKVVNRYGGALVEEFIVGREFTVLVAENADDSESPIIYKPFECIFDDPERFKHFTLKMSEYETLCWAPILDDDLCSKLKSYTSKIYKACGGSSFARCDYRMCAKTGQVYFLEINPQCGVCGMPNEYCSADYILQYENNQTKFMQNLIRCAFLKWSKKNEQIRMDLIDFTGKCATLKARVPRNTILMDFGQLPHNLIRRSDSDRWPVVRKQIFLENSIRLSDNLSLEVKRQNLCEFDLLAFSRGSATLANITVDRDLRLVTLKDVEGGEKLILEKIEKI